MQKIMKGRSALTIFSNVTTKENKCKALLLLLLFFFIIQTIENFMNLGQKSKQNLLERIKQKSLCLF